jgi:hypothetical protein
MRFGGCGDFRTEHRSWNGGWRETNRPSSSSAWTAMSSGRRLSASVQALCFACFRRGRATRIAGCFGQCLVPRILLSLGAWSNPTTQAERGHSGYLGRTRAFKLTGRHYAPPSHGVQLGGPQLNFIAHSLPGRWINSLKRPAAHPSRPVVLDIPQQHFIERLRAPFDRPFRVRVGRVLVAVVEPGRRRQAAATRDPLGFGQVVK